MLHFYNATQIGSGGEQGAQSFSKLLRKGSFKREINIIPLINIVFLLLVFFLVTGNPESSNYGLTLPVVEKMEESQPVSLTTIEIIESGEISVNGEKIAVSELSKIVKNRRAKHGGDSVLIMADKSLSGLALVNIMEKLEQAGITNVSLLSERQR
jgi:biopolymer transport protein ExbD